MECQSAMHEMDAQDRKVNQPRERTPRGSPSQLTWRDTRPISQQRDDRDLRFNSIS